MKQLGYLRKIDSNNQHHHALLVIAISMLFTFAAPSAFAAGLCDNAALLQPNTVSRVKTLTAGGRQFYRVNAPSVGLLTLSTLGGTDTTGQLYDKDCLPINNAIDFSSGLDSNFLISETVNKGDYFLEVVGNLASTQGDYRIKIDGDFANDDHGVACNNATVMRNLSETGALKPYGDRDFFQVKVAGGTGQLTVLTEGPTDTTGRLYDQNCLFINGTTDFSSGPDNNFQIVTTLSPGIYYVEVEGNSPSIAGKYNLRISGDVAFSSGTCAGRVATISGTNGNDVLVGTAGNDVIQAYDGNDVVFGLDGNDIICGNNGDDVLQGGNGADRQFGQAGNDVLTGGGGNDMLDGGLDSDLCDGGFATDTALDCEAVNQTP